MMLHLRMLVPDMMTPAEVNDLCKAIWPVPYCKDAAIATVEDGLFECLGQVFLIQYGDTTVGLTGYFYDKGRCYLRWTGVLPQYRKRGYFAGAIKLLTLQLRGAVSGIEQIVELVPDNEYGRSIEGAFRALGFVADTTIPVASGEDADWPVVPYVLNF